MQKRTAARYVSGLVVAMTLACGDSSESTPSVESGVSGGSAGNGGTAVGVAGNESTGGMGGSGVAAAGRGGSGSTGGTGGVGTGGAVGVADASTPADGAPADASGPPERGPFEASCDTRTSSGPSENECRDWYGTNGPNLSVSCGGLGGTFSTTIPCPASERVGTCTLKPVLNTVAVYNYYPPKWNAVDAMKSCELLKGYWQ
jgi:hypothetical protein